jgi:bifunctional DNase/RNase
MKDDKLKEMMVGPVYLVPAIGGALLVLNEKEGEKRVNIYIGPMEATFFANIHITVEGGKESIIDARPSDAIALAVRKDVPILMAESVIEESVKSTEKFWETQGRIVEDSVFANLKKGPLQ